MTELLLNFISNNSFSVVIGTFIMALLGYYSYKYINERFETKRVDARDLHRHRIFTNIKRSINNRIGFRSIKDDNRRNIIRDMLHVKYSSVYVGMKELTDKTVCKISDDDLFHRITTAFTKIIRGYEDKWETLGIPKIAIDKFDEWHNTHIEYLLKFTETICYSDNYESQSEKLAIILDATDITLEVTIAEGDRGINELNGTLSKSPYKRNMEPQSLITI